MGTNVVHSIISVIAVIEMSFKRTCYWIYNAELILHLHFLTRHSTNNYFNFESPSIEDLFAGIKMAQFSS